MTFWILGHTAWLRRFTGHSFISSMFSLETAFIWELVLGLVFSVAGASSQSLAYVLFRKFLIRLVFPHQLNDKMEDVGLVLEEKM